jgi:hypothetical protein
MQATIGARGQFFFLLDIFFRHLWVCYFIVTFVTRGRVCNLLLVLHLASAIPPMSLYLYPPGTGWPSYTLGHWVPFPSHLTTRGSTVDVFWPRSPSRSYFTMVGQSVSQSVSQHVLVSSPLFDLWPDITSYRKVAVWKLRSCLFPCS